MVSPYTVLGLKDGSESKEARAAFRRLSKSMHPDRGGDPQKFAELAWAHEVLTDVERKAFWDENGFDMGLRSKLESEALEVLTGYLQLMLTQDPDPGDSQDLVTALKDHAHRETVNAKENLAKLNRAIPRVDQLRKRFRRRGGGNEQGSVVDNILANQREALAKAKHQVQVQIAQRNRVIEILSEYDDIFERAPYSIQTLRPATMTRNWLNGGT